MIDTHAGAGLTDLTGPEASRTGEWHDGIERLRATAFSPDIRALLQPYLDAVARFNPDGHLMAYPGSPLLATAWLRGDDRLLACELQPDVARSLAQNLKGETRATAVAIDGFTALTAFLPPKERRGVVLIGGIGVLGPRGILRASDRTRSKAVRRQRSAAERSGRSRLLV